MDLDNPPDESLIQKVKNMASTKTMAEAARELNVTRQYVSWISKKHGIVFAKDGRKLSRVLVGQKKPERIGGCIVTTHNAGAAAELAVCSDLLWRGFAVYRSVSPHASIDLIVCIEKKEYLKVEVKCGRILRNGSISYATNRTQKYDVLAIVTGTNTIRYLGKKAKKIVLVDET